MALEGGDWGALAGALIIILAMFGYVHFAGRRNAAGGDNDDGPSVDPMLSRFAVHDGNVIGEVMAAEETQVVVKHQGKFQAFDRSLTVLKGDEVHIVGDVDMDAASTAGDAWLAANRKGQDDAVSAHLTTSADVKKPAREAFEERTEELAGDDSEE